MAVPSSVTRKRDPGRVLREVLHGMGIAWSGLRTWSTSGRLMAWGLVPGVLTMVLFASAAIVIASQLVDWSEAIANALVSQDGSLNTVVQVVAAVAIVLGAVVLGAYTFT